MFQFMARALHLVHPGLLEIRRDAREPRMESVPVRMTVRWRVPAGEAQSITTALQSLMLQTRAAPGCAGCSVSTEMGALVVIQYRETWKTETDMRRQVRSDRFSALAELIERATEHPEIEFMLSDGRHGLEYAEEVRRF
jgi:quinol monooxygenase YgiN